MAFTYMLELNHHKASVRGLRQVSLAGFEIGVHNAQKLTAVSF